jgi:glucose dehydrogenase
MKSSVCTTSRKQLASFSIAGLMLAIVPLLLMLATANTPAHAQASTPSPADWRQFLRDNMQRWNPYETILGVNNVGSLEVKWSFAPGSSFFSGRTSSPAVVNGVIYVGSFDNNVYALYASTGAKVWSLATGGSVQS